MKLFIILSTFSVALLTSLSFAAAVSNFTANATGDTKTISFLNSREGATVSFERTSDHSVKNIEINVINPANNIRITVTKLDQKPANVVVEVSGKVYKYIDINSNIPSVSISDSKITFEVPRSWISANNIDSSKVSLNRYANNNWQKLPTRLVDSSPTTLVFEATTQGFSIFAITGEQVSRTPTPTPTPPPAPTGVSDQLRTVIGIIFVVIIAVSIIMLVKSIGRLKRHKAK